MKYGILYRKTTRNIGDDMQSYAAEQWLGQADYMVDIEELDSFKSDDNEPVATIMSAWYMWQKWNWPPSKDIYPLWIGFHYNDIQRGRLRGMPSKFEYIDDGPGLEYLKAHQPIGCRDYYTQARMSERGIDNYFSGCITLTLKKRKIIKPEKEYVVLVGLSKEVRKAVKKQLKDTGIEVIVVAPRRRDTSENMTWEERRAEVEQLLDLYQNAKCVLSFRLHCVLPCLALEVPVLFVREDFDSVRLDPYKHWLNKAFPQEVIDGKFRDYMLNPTPNSDAYKPTRKNLEKIIGEFVSDCKQETRKADALVRTTYTDEQLKDWQHATMKKTLHNFHIEHHIDLETINEYKRFTAKVEEACDGDVDRMLKEYNTRIVRLAIKIRHFLLRIQGKKY